MDRCYSELMRLRDREARFNYLALRGRVGEATFGFERYLNQNFYRSREWRSVRHRVILRDNGCDMGLAGFEIHETIYIHHMNPMTVDDVARSASEILDPEFLISVTHKTHNAIHYGDVSLLAKPFVERAPGDTTLWRR